MKGIIKETYCKEEFIHELLLTLLRGQKDPPTSFFPVTSTNVGISPPKFSDLYSFNPFATLVLNFKAIPNASPKLLNLN